MRSLVFVSSLIILLAADVNEAVACSCAPAGPPCQNYFQSDTVFIGTVRSIAAVPGADFRARMRVEFEDVVASRGVQGTSVTTFTAEHEVSCGYPFKPGVRYVVYARKVTDQLVVTSICSRTRPLAEADDDVAFFRTLTMPATGGRVFGTVTRLSRNPATTDWQQYGAVSIGVLTLSNGDQKLQAQTDLNGHYQFIGVAPGAYELTVTPPPPFSTEDLTERFELRDPRACFHADFSLKPDGRIGGTLVQADGRPVARAEVDLLPADHIGHFLFREIETATTDESGRFEITRLSPGRYILAFNVAQPVNSDIVFPTVFHPAASDPRNAAVLELGEGDRIENMRIVVPPAPRSYRITGRVLFQDGKPAGNATVSLTDGHGRWSRVAEDVQTGADGTFSFVVHDGLTYLAGARYAEPGTQRTQAAGSVSFTASEEKRKDLEVVLRPR
jgi:protocatechuate 3,4-dioxygenase beta subunit